MIEKANWIFLHSILINLSIKSSLIYFIKVILIYLNSFELLKWIKVLFLINIIFKIIDFLKLQKKTIQLLFSFFT